MEKTDIPSEEITYTFSLVCSRKNPHLPDRWDSENSRGRGGGGSKTLEIQAGKGVELEKVFCRGYFD